MKASSLITSVITTLSNSTKTVFDNAIESNDAKKMQSALQFITNKRDRLMPTLQATEARRGDAFNALDDFRPKAYAANIQGPSARPVTSHRGNPLQVRFNVLHASWKNAEEEVERLADKVEKYNNRIDQLTERNLPAPEKT